MTLGRADRQVDLFDDAAGFCEEKLPENSIYRFLARERDRSFPDGPFADLFTDRGQRSVPPSVVATMMVLRRLEGQSDREGVDRYAFDVRWRYAAGVGGYGSGGWGRFAHTVLVDMRERLRRSARPDRIFEVGLQAAAAAGLVGRRRVLDSTPLYDAVATMDTVTLIRSTVRGLLAAAGAADAEWAAALRAVLTSGDDYASRGKPQIDWDDPAAREELIDSRARDGLRCSRRWTGASSPNRSRRPRGCWPRCSGKTCRPVRAECFASPGGSRRIGSSPRWTRTPGTGHKTAARGFDGYKGHAAVDPDSEIITATTVTPGNAGDATVAEDLISDLFTDAAQTEPQQTQPQQTQLTSGEESGEESGQARPTVYGDNAYGTAGFHTRLSETGIESRCKTQAPTAAGGLFSKDRFDIDLGARSVRCPAGTTAPIRAARAGGGTAYFGATCDHCPLRAHCTTAAGGRTVSVGPHEQAHADARARQADPAWIADYRNTRPRIEHKLGHMMRRNHGGRRARVRGTARVDADFRLLAAAVNIARLAVLRLHQTTAGWAVAA